jgi:chromosome segregation ATPase
MARGGINKVLVRTARAALLARGVHPSIDTVRVELGNTGSRTTIQRYLKELGTQDQSGEAPTLSEELQYLISSLAQRLNTEAQAALIEERLDFNQQQLAAQQHHDLKQGRIEELQQTVNTLAAERRDDLLRERQLNERLREAESERRRLQQVELSQQRLVEELSGQIRSLDEKNQHARESLEHYRQQQLSQREQELQRHDAQLQQLQHEARALREQLLHKDEALAQLYRELERLTVELREQGKHTHRLEQEAQQLHTQQEELEARRETAQSLIQTLNHEVTTLRQHAKKHLLSQRQAQQNQREQMQQVRQLQALLERLTRSPPEAG